MPLLRRLRSCGPALGLVWSGPHSNTFAKLYRDWTDTLMFFADGQDIKPDIRADLASRNVPGVDGRIVEWPAARLVDTSLS